MALELDIAMTCEGRVKIVAEFVDHIVDLSIDLKRLIVQFEEKDCIAAFNKKWLLNYCWHCLELVI